MTSEDSLPSFDFELPEERIAKRPLDVRSSARLLVLRAHDAAPSHAHVRDLAEMLAPGDVLVVNDTTVIPARLFGEKAGTGGKIECLLIRKDGDSWVCLLNASKKPKPGTRLVFEGAGIGDALIAEVEGAVADEAGAFRVKFMGDALAFSRHFGHVPLPPYIDRADDDADLARYQTVFHDAHKAGSSAAPTAGLHFDDALLDAIAARGVTLAKVTLHVGPGTFLPVRTENLNEHVMHPEPWWVPEETARAVADARAAGKRVVAVGTTSLRALESSVDEAGVVRAGAGLTRLFLRPAVQVRSIDALITNFHLPKSTLFVLACALAGTARMKQAYAEAIREGYRFYSYGDTSFIENTSRPKS